MGLQDPPLHMLQQITDGVDVGMRQLITLGLGICTVGPFTSPTLSSPLGKAASTLFLGNTVELAMKV